MKPIPDATHMGTRMPPSATHSLNRTFSSEHQQQQHRIVHRKKSASSAAGNFTMHDCYEKLKELVPTIPKNKKMTRVQILQHVIDYIQDLQSALESYNIDVNNVDIRNSMGSVMDLAAQFNVAAQHSSHHHPHHQPQQQTQCAPNRTPFTTVPQTENLPPHHPQQQIQQQNCSTLEWQQRQVIINFTIMFLLQDFFWPDFDFPQLTPRRGLGSPRNSRTDRLSTSRALPPRRRCWSFMFGYILCI